MPIDHAIPVFIAAMGVLSLGLKLSALIYTTLPISQRLTVLLGFEPLDPHAIKRISSKYLDRILGPILPSNDSGSQPPRKERLTCFLVFGSVVTVLAITVEVASILTVTGYAGYQLAGMTMDLTTAYHRVVAVLTIAVMGYGHDRITHPPVR